MAEYDNGRTLTVAEAKIRSGQLRRDIASAVFTFEQETGLCVESIELEHFHVAYDKLAERRTRIGGIEISLMGRNR